MANYIRRNKQNKRKIRNVIMKKKHRFICGHVGFGKKCHRCEIANSLKDLLKSKKNSSKEISIIKEKIEYLEQNGKESKWRTYTK